MGYNIHANHYFVYTNLKTQTDTLYADTGK